MIRRQKPERSRVSLVVLGLVGVAGGCVDTDSERDAQEQGKADAHLDARRSALKTERDIAIEDRLNILELHEGVVEGVVEVRAATGETLAVRGVKRMKAPDRLGELMETGEQDSEGYSYIDVSGAVGDGLFETRYKYVQKTKAEVTSAGPVPRPPSVEPSGLRIGPEFRAMVAEGDQLGEAHVYLGLEGHFTTALKPASAKGIESLYGAEQDYRQRRASIEARKLEAAALQSSAKQILLRLGGHEIGGFWMSNAVEALVPKAILGELLKIPGLRLARLVPETTVESSTQWDGVDIRAPGGMNSAIYDDAGYHGQAYQSAGGRTMRIGMVSTTGYYDHPGFKDSPNTASRIAAVYDCSFDPGASGPGSDATSHAHDLKCAGLATGSLNQGQISGYTATERTERTGVAEEPELYFFQGRSLASVKRALELAVDLEVDFLSMSAGVDSGCDGRTTVELEDQLLEAQRHNVLMFKSAGNAGQSGCTVTDPGGTPTVLTVAGLGSGSSTCTSSNYSSCPIWSGSSRGGIDGSIDGVALSEALSGVSLAAPACPQYYYTDYSPTEPEPYVHVYSGNPVCGTSYATPQVAGAAILMKDYFLANGDGFIGIEGRPFVVMLAMGDRQGTSGYLTTGFDPVFGAGRFQLRRFDSSDNAAPWGWESYSFVFSSAGAHNHSLWGTGAEPSGIGQAKVVSMHFEGDSDDMAQIDLRLRGGNCTGTSLGLDTGSDVKKRVTTTAASGEQLCARLNAIHLPDSRRAHVFAYYSSDTAMR